jgi:hypothetical protein
MLHAIEAVMLPTQARGANSFRFRGLRHHGKDRRGARFVRYWDGPVSAKVNGMARGFESKSVESQQEEAQRAKSLRPALSPEEQARQAQRAGLELALAQTQAEMSAACRPAHREMLKLRLEAIQAQLQDL